MKAWTLFVVSVTRQKGVEHVHVVPRVPKPIHRVRSVRLRVPRMLTVKLMLKLTLELTLRLARGADAEADAMLKLAVADGSAR